MLDAEAQPPHVERGEPVQRGGGKRHAVIGPHGPRQPVFAEQPIEDGPHAGAPRREQAVAGQQVAGVLVGHGERVAIDPITGAELPLEVGRPQVIGRVRDRRHDTGVLRGAAATPFLHEAMPRQQITGRADGRPRDTRVPRLEPLQQFLRAPVGMLLPCGEEELRHRRGDLVRAGMRRSTPVVQGRASAGVVARQPFVARLATDGVAGAELGHVVQPESVIVNEAFALFHR